MYQIEAANYEVFYCSLVDGLVSKSVDANN